MTFSMRFSYVYVSLSIYVCSGSVVPAIWFLELHEYDERLQKHICQDTRSWMQLTLLQTNPGCQLSKNSNKINILDRSR